MATTRRSTVEFYLEIAAAAAAGATEQQSEVTGAQLLEALAAARSAGVSWEPIGEILGMTAWAAHQCYETSTKVDEVVASQRSRRSRLLPSKVPRAKTANVSMIDSTS